MIFLCTDIEFDREEGEILPNNLPKTLLVTMGDENESVTDAITDRTGYMVSGCNFRELTALEFSSLLASAMSRRNVKIERTDILNQFIFTIDGVVVNSQNPDVVFGCLIEDELAQTETE